MARDAVDAEPRDLVAGGVDVEDRSGPQQMIGIPFVVGTDRDHAGL